MRGRTFYFQNRRLLVRCGAAKNPPHGINDEYGQIEQNVALKTRTKTEVTGGTETGVVEEESGGGLASDIEHYGCNSEESGTETELKLPHETDNITTETAEFTEADTSEATNHADDAIYTATADFGEKDAFIGALHKTAERVYHSVFGSTETKNGATHQTEAIYTATADFGEANQELNESHDIDPIYTSVADLGETDEHIETINEADPIYTETADLGKADESRELTQNINAEIEALEFGVSKTEIKTDHIDKAEVQNAEYFGNGEIRQSINVDTSVEGTLNAENDYIKIKGTSTITLKTNNKAKNWDGTLYYSTDGENWTEWNGTQISGAQIYLRGKNNTYISRADTKSFVLGGTAITIEGKLTKLLDYEIDNPTMAASCFAYLFFGNQTIIDVSALIMPDYAIPNRCFEYFFENCMGLIYGVALPSISLGDGCYWGFYSGCTSLITLSAIYATVIPSYALRQMYENCTKIKISATKTGIYTNDFRIPIEGIGTAAVNSFGFMFDGTGGTFTSDFLVNTTYYTSNEIIS